MIGRLKRKIKRKLRNMSTNKLVMFISVFLVCFITIGYASLNQILKLVGYASIDKGDGIIFTNIITKENNGAIVVTAGNIKAKTLVNTQVSFDAPGSITYTVTAENQAEYDAKLIEIKDLELTNNKDPKCITVSINGHEINDKIYTGATKDFDITITSTCNVLETKEVSLKFNYVKTDTINGEVPIPTSGNTTEELLQNSEKTYNYLDGTYLGGSQSTNYVWFNGFMWRIMGKNADGSIRMITEENITAIPWGANDTAEQYDSSYANDWLNNYFYSKLKNKEYLVKQTWCSETTTSSSSSRTTCTSNLSTTPQYVGLLSLDEYNLASGSSSYLHISQYFWTLTPYSVSYAWSVGYVGTAYNNSVSNARGVRPVINISSEITITGGNGTLTDPYMFEDKSSSVTGTLKDNSQIGEYVTYAGRNYRVVETSENGTKLILDGYYDSNNNGTIDSSDKMSYGTNCTLCTTINEDNFINWLSNNNEEDKNKLASITWYRGDYWGSSSTTYNYKTNLDSTGNPYEGSVGLIRIGEMLSGQSETILSKNHTVTNSYSNTLTYWTATPYSVSYAWNVYSDGNADLNSVSFAYGFRPVINISSEITITGGNGTPNSPYQI